MNSNVRRTVISLPVALGALALFTATSQNQYTDLAETEIAQTLTLDENGEASGTLSFTVSVKPEDVEMGYLEVYVRIGGDDARRSLDGREVGTDSWTRVRDGVSVYRSLSDCEVVTSESDEDTGGDTGGEPSVTGERIENCPFSIAFEFSGRDLAEEPITLSASVGGWDLWEDSYTASVDDLVWTLN